MTQQVSGRDEEFSDLLIHIGYHKTGSTLLQKSLFTQERGFWSPWTQSFYHRSILLDRPDRGWASRVRCAFMDEIDRARELHVKPVLSCEALSGDIWRSGQANGYGNFHVARLLAEAFPGARILIVVREQAAMICSLYKHSIRSHWRYSPENFVDQASLLAGMAPVLNFGYLEYSWLTEQYHELFGPTRVLTLPFELLRDASGWSERLSRFVDVVVEPHWFEHRENIGMSAAASKVKRYANHLIPATATPNRTAQARLVNRAAHQVDLRIPSTIKIAADRKLRDQIATLVGDRFAADNTRLFDVLSEDWSSFGYPQIRP